MSLSRWRTHLKTLWSFLIYLTLQCPPNLTPVLLSHNLVLMKPCYYLVCPSLNLWTLNCTNLWSCSSVFLGLLYCIPVPLILSLSVLWLSPSPFVFSFFLWYYYVGSCSSLRITSWLIFLFSFDLRPLAATLSLFCSSPLRIALLPWFPFSSLLSS